MAFGLSRSSKNSIWLCSGASDSSQCPIPISEPLFKYAASLFAIRAVPIRFREYSQDVQTHVPHVVLVRQRSILHCMFRTSETKWDPRQMRNCLARRMRLPRARLGHHRS